jgi:hypothetical protein
MMPKEKAYELVILFTYKHNNVRKDLAKRFALIAVDTIIRSREDDSQFDDTLSSTGSEYYTPHPMYLTYWLQVKQEIEKL